VLVSGRAQRVVVSGREACESFKMQSIATRQGSEVRDRVRTLECLSMNDPRPAAVASPIAPAALEYPFDHPPAPGTWYAIAPGVFWLRMPLPFALDHINLWVLQDGPGWTLVDTGFNSQVTRDLWDRLVDNAFAALPVQRVIVTHFHPDHFGLAGWLTRRFGVTLWMTEAEFLTAQIHCAQLPPVAREAAIELFARHGLDAERQESLRQQKHSYARAVSEPPASFNRMLDGDQISIDGRSWQVITGYGHAPEHAALYCAEIGALIAGDMVLPKISTNVSVWPTEPDGDPLSLFLHSVDRYAALPERTLILPSHGLPFYGLRARAAALREHHRLRLDEVLTACAEPVSAADVIPILFRRQLDTHQVSFAMGEAIAHLNHLMLQRKVARTLDSHGVLRFHRI
jgi:glyoxylase-like metal-dependent hydrolase (beta-lactamase superfamily II)